MLADRKFMDMVTFRFAKREKRRFAMRHGDSREVIIRLSSSARLISIPDGFQTGHYRE
jgi:hypothetical protein